MKNQTVISWTPDMLARLKARMVETGDAQTFVFEGNTYVRAYARYLVEYLEGEFKRAGLH